MAHLLRHAPAWLLAAAILMCTPAGAQGILVIDVANLAQAIHQLEAWEQQWHQMQQQLQQQLQQLQAANRHIDAVTGSRGLGTFANQLREPLVEPGFAQDLAAATTHEEAARVTEAQARRINAATAQRYQQIQALMAKVDATSDPKGVQELSARIGAEQAMLAMEQKELAQLQQDFQARRAALDRRLIDEQRQALRQVLIPVPEAGNLRAR